MFKTLVSVLIGRVVAPTATLGAATLLMLLATAIIRSLARRLEPERRSSSFVRGRQIGREHRDRARAAEVVRPVLG